MCLTTTASIAITALTLAACSDGDGGSQGSSQPQGSSLELTIGTKNFTESFLTGELYAQALRADGVQVTLRKDIGLTEEIDKALEAGDIDAYPENLSVAATVVAGEDVTGKDSDETSKIARDFYASRDQSVSDETPFENIGAIAVSTPFARDNSLRTIADLGDLDSFTLAPGPSVRPPMSSARMRNWRAATIAFLKTPSGSLDISTSPWSSTTPP